LKELFKNIYSDLLRYKDTYKLRNDSKNFLLICLESFAFKPGFQSTFLYRIASFLHKKNLNYLAWGITRFNQFSTSAEIEYNAKIGPGLLITHPGGIVIGRGSKIGKNCTLYQNVTLGTKNWETVEYPEIEDNVVIFAGAAVLGGIRVQNNAVVGTNAVVTLPVLSGCVAVGHNKVIANKNK
jgi:serine O-acetyltransferase